MKVKRSKYSYVTGEKKKNKSLRKIKKEHKLQEKAQRLEEKKLAKKQKKLEKKLKKDEGKIESVSTTLSRETKSLQSDEVKEKVLIVRRSAQTKPMTKTRKFLNFFSYVLVGVFAVGFGYMGGNFYYANYMNVVDYSKFSEATLRDDGAAVYNSVKSKSPSLVSAIEAFVAAEYNLSQTLNYTTKTTGSVQPSIGSLQTVRGNKARVGNMFYGENYSKGMLAIAEKFEYNADTDEIKIYRAEGSAVGVDSAKFPDAPTSLYNEQSYRAEYGTSPSMGVISYIVSSKTYIAGSDSVKPIAGGKYQLKFSLSNDSSVVNYVKQVKHISGLPSYPTFKSITVTAVIDSSYRFESLVFDETYSVVYFGVPATCVGHVEEQISY